MDLSSHRPFMGDNSEVINSSKQDSLEREIAREREINKRVVVPLRVNFEEDSIFKKPLQSNGNAGDGPFREKIKQTSQQSSLNGKRTLGSNSLGKQANNLYVPVESVQSSTRLKE